MIVAVSMATFKLKAVTNILPSGKNIFALYIPSIWLHKINQALACVQLWVG